ncbi:FG-GAP repeat domain-containing protein [Maribacter ulvicola]|uniref:Repeat domain-containing protein n=1 Tax=Maribacter ulvicola TaxID=228959 RepID=A0A1N6ZXA7_9FLAO|nr:VCBS repeat-containing protein [Maribacter ulvicola]SIR31470.1 Repeat domain-containing protein [Maribacter ulvicola]
MSSAKLTSFCFIKALWVMMACCYVNAIKAQIVNKPPTNVSFKKVVLLEKYISEGASIADMDNDGQVDVVAGNLWWKGPDFKEVYAYGPVRYFPISGPGIEGYSTNFFTFPMHIDKNRWVDILQIGLPGTDSKWVKDPGKNLSSMTNLTTEPEFKNAVKNVCHESPVLANVIGDKKKELLAFSQGRLILGMPSKKPNKDWDILAISEEDKARFPVYSHGLGIGDINGDGLNDVVEKSGWWEQPLDWNGKTTWRYHPYSFSIEKGGAQILVFDVDGDGDNDVVTAIDAHGYGLSWFQQVVSDGKIGFKEHKVMTSSVLDNPYAVSFSQLHSLAKVDIDNDGILDIVTGKCYYAHNGRDPGSAEPPVLYWFKTHRFLDGTTELIPYRIDDNSGVGRQISVGDLNGDGKNDIVTANKKGVFAFLQE